LKTREGKEDQNRGTGFSLEPKGARRTIRRSSSVEGEEPRRTDSLEDKAADGVCIITGTWKKGRKRGLVGKKEAGGGKGLRWTKKDSCA